MKNKLSVLLIVVLILLICQSLYLKKKNETKLETLIEQLQIKNDSLKLSNELLDTQIALQRALADSLSKEVQITNRVIKKLKNVRYERIRTITDMDNNELIEFFAEFESTSTDN